MDPPFDKGLWYEVLRREDSVLTQRGRGQVAKAFLATEISYTYLASPIGKMLVAASDRGICFLSVAESEEDMVEMLKSDFPQAEFSLRPSSGSTLEACVLKVLKYFQRENELTDVPLDPRGTDFQKKVWHYLQTIPQGSTQSYTEVAKGIGHPRSVRAVASACARNKIAILIPCHRVVRQSGGLAGYRWGLPLKEKLLNLEAGQ